MPGLPPIAPVAAPMPVDRESRRAAESAPQVRTQTRVGLDASARSEMGYGGPGGRSRRGQYLDLVI